MPEIADPTKEAEAAAKAAAEAAPKFMTAEEINKALTAREKRTLDKIQEMIKAAMAPAKKPEAAADAEEADADADDADADETDAVEAAPAKKPAAEPSSRKPTKSEIAAKKALAKATAMEKQMAQRDGEMAKEREVLAARAEKNETVAALNAAGAQRPNQAIAVLKAENRIKRTDDGEFIFVMPRDIAGEKFDEEMPLADGIKEWLTTDEGKIYAPPKGVEGSGAGAQGGKGSGKALKDMSKDERKRMAGAALLKWATSRNA